MNRSFPADKPHDPRPALIGSGEPEEKRRSHGHITAGHGKRPVGKNGVEREMDG